MGAGAVHVIVQPDVGRTVRAVSSLRILEEAPDAERDCGPDGPTTLLISKKCAGTVPVFCLELEC